MSLEEVYLASLGTFGIAEALLTVKVAAPTLVGSLVQLKTRSFAGIGAPSRFCIASEVVRVLVRRE